MKNLKVWQKLGLLVLVLLFPLFLVTYRLITSMNTLGIAFAQKEIYGTQYSSAVRFLLEHVQQHRAISIAFVSGDTSFQEKFVNKQKEIIADIQTMEQLDAQLGSVLKTAQEWSQLKGQVHDLLQTATALNARQLYERHTQIAANILQYLSYIADTSNLILDPDLDSYYLMDVVVNQLPTLAETIGQTRAIGITVTAQKSRSENERTALMKRAVLAESRYSAVQQAFEKVVRYSPQLQAQVETIGKNSAEVTKQFLTVLDQQIINTPVVTMSSSDYYDVATRTISATFAAYDQTMPVLTELLQARIKRLSREVYRTLVWAIAGLSVVLLIGIFIIRDITYPLQTAVTMVEKIANGDLITTISLDGRRDEIGTLFQSFDRMGKKLAGMAGVAEKIAARDLTVTVTPQSQADLLGNALAAMVQNLLGVTSQLQDGTKVLSNSINRILTSTTQLAASSTETATAVHQTVTTVEEVKQTAQVNGQKAHEASQHAQRTTHIAETGERAVEDAIVDMRHIREQMESIAQSVVHLDEQSQTIASIIATVEGLAEQSNLLALNAEIEAAKAGEQGKGFAVVAQEVRHLATQSKHATTEVRSILQEIGKASALTITVTQKGVASVAKGMQQSIEAGEAIHLLAKNIAEATHAFTLVAASSEQQLIGIEQVAQAMGAIKQSSVHNLDGTQQIERATRELHRVGQELQHLMQQYKLTSATVQ